MKYIFPSSQNYIKILQDMFLKNFEKNTFQNETKSRSVTTHCYLWHEKSDLESYFKRM